MSPRLPDNAMLSADSGSGTNWYARHVKMRGTMRGTLSGTLATMGCAFRTRSARSLPIRIDLRTPSSVTAPCR